MSNIKTSLKLDIGIIKLCAAHNEKIDIINSIEKLILILTPRLRLINFSKTEFMQSY